MAITEAFANSQAVDTTEWSITTDTSYDTGDAQTTDGIYQVFLDVSDMVAGDQLQIRFYEKVQAAGTQRIIEEFILIGAQATPVWTSPSLILLHGWDITLDALSGTITELSPGLLLKIRRSDTVMLFRKKMPQPNSLRHYQDTEISCKNKNRPIPYRGTSLFWRKNVLR